MLRLVIVGAFAIACLGSLWPHLHMPATASISDARNVWGGCDQLGLLTTPSCEDKPDCYESASPFDDDCYDNCVNCAAVKVPNSIIASYGATMLVNKACPAGTMNGVCPLNDDGPAGCACPGPLIPVACGFYSDRAVDPNGVCTGL
jgi:hypothetical protein